MVQKENNVLWSWKKYEDLTLNELYEILRIRQKVFVLEQKCFYVDLDGKDNHSFHLFASLENQVIAYLRVICPIADDKVIRIGRVLTADSVRKQGFGKQIMEKALQKISEHFDANHSICLAAQVYLESFYKSFGFQVISEPYDDDGIMHIDMIKEKK